MSKVGGAAIVLAGFIAACVAIQFGAGAYTTDRGLTNDEAAHFVNSLLILDFLREAPFSNPLRYALDYYAHLPRVSIGHWPPMFYIVQAAVFGLFGRSGTAAMAFQAVVAGVACGWPAILVQRRLGWLAGICAGLAVLASPVLLFLLDAVMLDTFLALWVLGAALTWAQFARRPGLGWAALFAVCAIGAIMTKGNGFGLALLPPLYAAITRDTRPLRDWRAWLAAVAIAIVTIPWYALTYRMAADGFNYAWGWDYTGRAIPAYARALVPSLGVIGLIGFASGVVAAARRVDGERDQTLASLAATVLAMALFQVVAPAYITPRYLVSLVPAAVVVSALGLAFLVRQLIPRPPRVAGLAVAALLLVNAATIVALPRVAPFGMGRVAQRVLQAEGGNPLVLIAGSGRAEGALIAAFAALDPARTHYVLRGTQLLGTGNFMGTQYQERFATSDELARWLDDSGIGWLVVDDSAVAKALAANRQIDAVLAAPRPGWELADEHRSSEGEVRLFRLPAARPTPDQMQDILQRIQPNMR